MDINKVTLIGRLTKAPEKRTLASGRVLATFTVATNHVGIEQATKEKNECAEFHQVVARGKLAEIADSYLKKGSRIYVEGRIRFGHEQRLEISADEIILLGEGSTARDQGAA